MNGREFIIFSGKVVSVQLSTDRKYAYKSQQSCRSNALQRWHPVVFVEGGE